YAPATLNTMPWCSRNSISKRRWSGLPRMDSPAVLTMIRPATEKITPRIAAVRIYNSRGPASMSRHAAAAFQALSADRSAGLHPGVDHLGSLQVRLHAAGGRGRTCDHRDHRIDRPGRAARGGRIASRLADLDLRFHPDHRGFVSARPAVERDDRPAR